MIPRADPNLETGVLATVPTLLERSTLAAHQRPAQPPTAVPEAQPQQLGKDVNIFNLNNNTNNTNYNISFIPESDAKTRH
jgi:hypothetical protein